MIEDNALPIYQKFDVSQWPPDVIIPDLPEQNNAMTWMPQALWILGLSVNAHESISFWIPGLHAFKIIDLHKFCFYIGNIVHMR